MDSRLPAADKAIADNRRADAVGLIIAALDDGVAPSVQIYRVLTKNLMVLGRHAEAAVWAARAVDLDPANYDLLNNLGVLLRRAGRYDEALAVFDRAIALRPTGLPALFNKGNVCNDIRDGAAAAQIFARLVDHDPGNPELHRSLGRALWIQHRPDAAAASMRQAITLRSDDPDTWLELSAMLTDSGRPEAGLALLDEAIAANPDAPRLLQAKAEAYRRLGRASDAEAFLESLRDRMGGEAWYHHELGKVLVEIDRPRANDHFRKVLTLDPGNIDARLTLVETLDRTRQVDEGAYVDEAYRLLEDVELPGQLVPGHRKVAFDALTRAADYDLAGRVGDFRELGRCWATNSVHSALLGQMPRVKTAEDRRELLHQHRLWGDSIIERARRDPIRRPATAARSTKIRLGFMSSDLRRHVVTNFAWPLFEHADRDRFDIYCYSFFAGKEADSAQQFIASRVNAFRWHPSISDHDAAQMIADDQLDILFELGGSTHMNKLEVMAWKPARLCASWLGYPHSAGLSTIDHLLVDPHLLPPDPALLIEKPLIMPRSWIAMSERAFPEHHQIEPIAPVRRNGAVTFGTANNPYKYNPAMLRTWARVMARVPGSRFVFVRPEAGSAAFQLNIRAYFEAEEVAGDRLEFRSIRLLHMPHYNDIDIALDTFPQTGGSTTCDALWMGVPTVSLVGEALFERLSFSILHNAGLGDLCATSPDQYIEIAVALAADADRLQALRTGLRDQIRASPLGQTRQFARDFYDLVARTVAAAAGTPPLSSTGDPA